MKKKRYIGKIQIILLVSILVLGIALYLTKGRTFTEESHLSIDPDRTIGHAGGAVDGERMTNTIDALEENYEKGKRLFEIDLSRTSDGDYIGLHDWDGYLSRYIDITKDQAMIPMALDEILAMDVVNGWELITLDRLVKWVEGHPDARIITDTKKDNVDMLSFISDHYPELIEYTIPQIYSEDEYDKVKALGYKDIIFTLYMGNPTPADVLEFAENHKLYGITISDSRIEELGWDTVLEVDTPVFVHTINEIERAEELFDRGVEKIYTDFL